MVTNGNGDKSTERKGGAGTRWWEFYFVRYAMGTVVGALLFYALCQGGLTLDAKPILSDLLRLPTDAKELSTAHLFLLTAYGLTFCYVASAPVLVLHAARFCIRRWWIGLLIAALIAAVFTWILNPFNPPHLQLLFGFVATTLWILQILSVIWTIVHRKELFDFYSELAEKRDANSNSSLIESYRHLREHGNSFFILMCEIIFAAWLTIANSSHWKFSDSPKENFVYELGILVALWILPAVCVWIIGNLIEGQYRTHAGT